jgi:uncharacterized membrane protein
MTIKQYKQVRAAIAVFIGMLVSIATVRDSYLLAIAAVVTGMLFLILVRTKVRVVIDEREKLMREKAAQLTYAIFAPTIAIGSFMLLLPSKSGMAVFAKGEFVYIESLGMILAYLALFLIALYAICYYFLSRQYGGSGDEE